MKKHVWGCIGVVVWLSLSSTVLAQENKLVIWSHWATEPIKQNFMNAVIEAFQKETNIPVEIHWLDKAEFTDKLPFALKNGELDISYIDLGFRHPRTLQQLADLGDLQMAAPTVTGWKLTDLDEKKNAFLAIEGVSHGIYYNKDLFQQAGITLPQDRLLTNLEFLDIVKKLRAAGITPISEGLDSFDTGSSIPLLNAMLRIAGPEKVEKLLKAEINFSDPDILAALTFWKEVVDAQGYDPQKLTTTNLQTKIFDVIDGNAAMLFLGTWIYGKYGATEKDKGQLGVFDWFTFENGQGSDFYEIIWAAGYGINAHSPRLAEAKKFLEFLLTPTSGVLWAQHVQAPYPVVLTGLSTDTLYGALMQFRTNQQPTSFYYSFPYFPTKAANNMWFEDIQKFLKGELTVEKFVNDMNSRLRPAE